MSRHSTEDPIDPAGLVTGQRVRRRRQPTHLPPYGAWAFLCRNARALAFLILSAGALVAQWWLVGTTRGVLELFLSLWNLWAQQESNWHR